MNFVVKLSELCRKTFLAAAATAPRKKWRNDPQTAPARQGFRRHGPGQRPNPLLNMVQSYDFSDNSPNHCPLRLHSPPCPAAKNPVSAPLHAKLWAKNEGHRLGKGRSSFWKTKGIVFVKVFYAADKVRGGGWLSPRRRLVKSAAVAVMIPEAKAAPPHFGAKKNRTRRGGKSDGSGV